MQQLRLASVPAARQPLPKTGRSAGQVLDASQGKGVKGYHGIPHMNQDRHRPTYHHLPEEGLLWDPCAAVFRGGRYHLFYLHDSWAAAGPSKRSDGYNYKAWAHVSSADLVHWRRHQDAIARGQTSCGSLPVVSPAR